MKYTTKARIRGASFFDLEDVYRTLSPEVQQAANRHFLDIIADRNDRVILSVPKSMIEKGTALDEEIQYLTTRWGYEWVNQWSLRRR